MMTTEETETSAYDPTKPVPPARDPPRRSTAPQSPYTSGQVIAGLIVLLAGIALVFGGGLAFA